MKGIILAGGKGTRLAPLTNAISKQLLPVFDKPMIYYPLSMLMLAKIQQILIICSPEDLPNFQRLLKDGSQWGLTLSYAVQTRPRGLADAFIVGEEFIQNDPVCLILGDNIFFGQGLPEKLRQAATLSNGAIIFAYPVRNPERYGVVTFNRDNQAISLEEKPVNPTSHFAVPGLYFYDGKVVSLAKSLKPSERGEIEITDLNKIYLAKGELHVEQIGRGTAWLDAGTHESLLQASNFIQAIEERQGIMISCLEEIAYRMGFINETQFVEEASKYDSTGYGIYLHQLTENLKETKDIDRKN